VAVQSEAVQSEAVRFGAGLLGHTSAANGLDRVLEAAAICQTAGLDSFWVADQRWMRDVYVTLGALAAATDRIQLGTRVTDPYIRHPALTAVALATLDEASGGRAVLGIGAGGSGFAQLGLRREHPATAIREAIALIRQLWSGKDGEFRGELIHWAGGSLEFRCRPDIPVVIAARSPRLLELAGEVADGAIVAAGVAPGAIAWAAERIAEGERRAGRVPGSTEILHMTYVAVDSDVAAARRAVRHAIYGVVAGSHPRYEFLRAAGVEPPPALVAYLDGGGRDRTEVIARISDDMVDALTIAGTEDDCQAGLEALLAAGVDHIVLAPVAADETDEIGCLRRIASLILPRIRPEIRPAQR
jgi:5,10-methylenetetrahydromethanopterin reductase